MKPPTDTAAATTATDTAMALVLHPHDDVATALGALTAGQTVQVQGLAGHQGEGIRLRESIALCHKFALHDITCGAMVRKYGEAIGHATRDIRSGEHVHIHNLKSNRAA